MSGRVAGVVLAGGRSARMGASKAGLEWHGATLLHRTAAILGRTVDGPVVVVGAAGQPLPALPAGVAVVTDPVPALGPLMGIATGLAAVADEALSAFVCSTDLPFLHPAFVRRVVRPLTGLVPDPGVDAEVDAEVDVVLPVARGYRQPLAAAYRTTLAEPINALLAAGLRRPGTLFERCRVALLDDDALLADPDVARLDPGLGSLTNANTPDDYAAARARTPEPIVVVHAGGRLVVPVATLAAAAHAIGVALSDAAVALNGDAVAADPWLPLVAGDTVAFRPRTGPGPSEPSG